MLELSGKFLVGIDNAKKRLDFLEVSSISNFDMFYNFVDRYLENLDMFESIMVENIEQNTSLDINEKSRLIIYWLMFKLVKTNNLSNLRLIAENRVLNYFLRNDASFYILWSSKYLRKEDLGEFLREIIFSNKNFSNDYEVGSLFLGFARLYKENYSNMVHIFKEFLKKAYLYRLLSLRKFFRFFEDFVIQVVLRYINLMDIETEYFLKSWILKRYAIFSCFVLKKLTFKKLLLFLKYFLTKSLKRSVYGIVLGIFIILGSLLFESSNLESVSSLKGFLKNFVLYKIIFEGNLLKIVIIMAISFIFSCLTVFFVDLVLIPEYSERLWRSFLFISLVFLIAFFISLVFSGLFYVFLTDKFYFAECCLILKYSLFVCSFSALAGIISQLLWEDKTFTEEMIKI